MTLEEFYRQAGGNYDAAMKRFRDEQRLRRFLVRFAEESSFEAAKTALQAGDPATAFREVHSLKGNCMNLYLDGLLQQISVLTELLRPYSRKEDFCGEGWTVSGEIREESGKTEAALERAKQGIKELL